MNQIVIKEIERPDFDVDFSRREAEFLQAINAAAALLQRSVHSQDHVFRAFKKQIARLGLTGTLALLDENKKHLTIHAVAHPNELLERLEKLSSNQVEGFTFPVDKVDTFHRVVTSAEAFFTSDTRKTVLQLVTTPFQHLARFILQAFSTKPAIFAPLIIEGEVEGVLVISGDDFTPQDVPAIVAFANHIAVALENARLFQAMQATKERAGELACELKQQARMLDVILSTTPDRFQVFDREGQFLYVSPSSLKDVGLRPEEVIGKTWHDLDLPADFGEKFDQEREIVFDTGRPVTGETKFESPDGPREYEYSYNPVFDEEGEILWMVATFRDVTERKQTEEAMRHAQKMESLGVLAGGVAHDFNNLLVAILGQSSLALVKLHSDSPSRANLEKSVKAAERAVDLTQQLLAYAGRAQFAMGPLNLNELIEENLHLFTVTIPKHVTLEPELASSLPHIKADAGQMQQVIMNLILNAAEAIGDQPGTITVTTGTEIVDEDEDLYCHNLNQPVSPGEYVFLEVSDDGCGMDDETLSKIFDPFFTTKLTGRGLGLAAVSGIVRAHKGGMNVRSKVGEGTTFTLLFPAIDFTPEVPQETADSPPTATQPATILVIDDEQSVREALIDILELAGLQVMTAAGGAAGIALYRQHAPEIDLVLLDVSMPGMDGRETFRELVSIDPDAKVVLSSGYDKIEVEQRFKEIEVEGFIQKPYDARVLVREIRRHLAQNGHSPA